jgi:hypothetical protein
MILNIGKANILFTDQTLLILKKYLSSLFKIIEVYIGNYQWILFFQGPIENNKKTKYLKKCNLIFIKRSKTAYIFF